MFGIDFSEILVIFGIALVVLGPEKLPKLAQNIGRWIGRARAMARQFREQLEQEADAIQKTADLRAHMKPPSRPAYAPAADPDIGSAHMTPAPAPGPPLGEAPSPGEPQHAADTQHAAWAPADVPMHNPAAAPPTEVHERGQ
jgi:sec-independent protein translocase protein TatB